MALRSFYSVISSTFRIIAGLGCAFLSGCASTLLPHLSEDGKLEYSGQTDYVNCYAGTTSILDAKHCMYASIEELDTLLENVGKTERSFAYTALAGGTYAGIRLAKTNGSDAPLKYTAIGLASLLGLRTATDPVRQREVLSAGLEAMHCLADAAYAIEFASTTGLVTSNAASHPNFVALNNALRLSPATVSGTGAQFFAQRYTQKLLDFNQLAGAKNTALPGTLINATIRIRSRIRALLADYQADPKTIFDEQQAPIKAMLGELVAKGDPDEEAKLFSQYWLVETGQFKPLPTNPAAAPANETYARCVGPIDAIRNSP